MRLKKAHPSQDDSKHLVPVTFSHRFTWLTYRCLGWTLLVIIIGRLVALDDQQSWGDDVAKLGPGHVEHLVDVPSRGFVRVLYLTVSPDKKWLIVTAIRSSDGAFTVIDLENKSVVATKDFRTKTMTIFRFQNGILWGNTRGSSEKFELMLPSLERTSSNNEAPFDDKIAIGSKWWVPRSKTRTQLGRVNGLARYRQPDGELVPFPDLIVGLHESASEGLLTRYPLELLGRRLGDDWISEGVVFDNAMTGPKLLLRPWGFIRSEKLDLAPVLRLHHQVERNGAVGESSGRSQMPSFDLKDRMHWSVERLSRWDFRGKERAKSEVGRLAVVLRDQRTKASRRILLEEPGGSVRVPGCKVDEAIYFLVKEKLCRWTLDDPADPVQPDSPLRFELAQSHLVLASDNSTVLTHQVRGGRPPYQFSVAPPRLSDGKITTSIDPNNGNVRIDVDAATLALSRYGFDFNKRDKFAEAMKQYRSYADQQFAKLVGRPPDGIPVLLGITVQVTDQSGSTASLPYEVFAELSQDRYLAGINGQLARVAAINRERKETAIRNQASQRNRKSWEERKKRWGFVSPKERLPIYPAILLPLAFGIVLLFAAVLTVPLSAVGITLAYRVHRPALESSGQRTTVDRKTLIINSIALEAIVGVLAVFFAFLVVLVGINLRFPPAIIFGSFGMLYLALSVMTQVALGQQLLKLSDTLSWRISLTKMAVSIVVLTTAVVSVVSLLILLP